MQVLYRLTSPSGAMYIGQTCNFQARMANYKSATNKSQPLLYRSLKKYGFENHKAEILHYFGPDFVSQEAVDNFERYAIFLHRQWGRRLLNSTDGGKGTPAHGPVARALRRPDVQGEKHKLAKLTEAYVREIRRTYRRDDRSVGAKALATKYGVSDRLIYWVLNGGAWDHVDGDPTERPRTRAESLKLCAADVIEMRRRHVRDGISYARLAVEYRVSKGTAQKTCLGLRWGHVKPSMGDLCREYGVTLTRKDGQGHLLSLRQVASQEMLK